MPCLRSSPAAESSSKAPNCKSCRDMATPFKREAYGWESTIVHASDEALI